MNSLAARQHRHELFDSLLARLRLLRVMDAIQDRIAVGPIESIEVSSCGRIAIEDALKIRGYRRLARRCIGGFPSAIELRLLDFLHPGRLHEAELDQRGRAIAIQLRPLALGPAGREANQPMAGVESVHLAVNPSVTEGAVDCFPF